MLVVLAAEPDETFLPAARVSRVVVRAAGADLLDTPPLSVLPAAGRRAVVEGGVGRLDAVEDEPRGGSLALRFGARLVDEADRGRVVAAADEGRKPAELGGGPDGAGAEAAAGGLMGDDVGRGSIVGRRDEGACA